MTRSIITIILLCLLLIPCSGQNKGTIYIDGKKMDFQTYLDSIKYSNLPPVLSQQQMYEDFDTLLCIMEQCNPQVLVIKKVTGYDMIKEMKELRNCIPAIDNTFDFIKLLKQVLSMSIDGHHFIANRMYAFRQYYEKDMEINNIKDREIGIMYWYRDSIFYKNPPYIELIYSDGNYYLKHKTVFNKTVIPSETKILTYNNIPITKYQDSLKKWRSQWDYEKKQYYNRQLSFEKIDNELVFDISGQLTTCRFQHIHVFKPKNALFLQEKFYVQWIGRDSILFLRVPSMSDDDQILNPFYKKILHYQSYPIKAIIVDIRNNLGGNDFCWIGLMETIFADTLSYHHCLVMQDHPYITQRYSLQDSYKDYGFAKYRLLEEETVIFTPRKENIGYKGILYILRDENIFSSANAFASFATKTDKIKTVGTPTGRIGGNGTTPNIFLLPHSRFCFFLELAIDASHVKKAEDFYHDDITCKVFPTLAYYKWFNNLKVNKIIKITDKYKHDEIFLRALELIKNK